MPRLAHSITPTHRPFLKWAGGKFRLSAAINRVLPKNKTCLIEPFVGAGAIFLNSHFERYILADINPDLINLFSLIKQDVNTYIATSEPLFFHPKANSSEFYYQKRAEFNESKNSLERAALFLYLNRFGYNGLCRYNSRNEFNVPFGNYKKHYFPEIELRYFAEKAQRAEFICADFQQSIALANEDCVVYCDPPYAPLTQSSNFTAYAGNTFNLEHQRLLATLAHQSAQIRGVPVLISNHDTPFTREIYQGAKIRRIKVQRSISQTPQKREKVAELLALFMPQQLLKRAKTNFITL